MAEALHALSAGAAVPRWRPPWALRLAPALTLAAFVLPIVAGLAGTLLPAFGWLPALGGREPGFDAWRALS
jgi:putative thiamine transport system permease protein